MSSIASGRVRRGSTGLGVALIAALALNALVGTAEASAPRKSNCTKPTCGFVLEGGRYKRFDLPGLGIGTRLGGINNRGQIVGKYLDNDGYHGLLRDARGRFTQIDVPGAMGTYALKINDHGAIVGSYNKASPGVGDPGTKAYVLERGRFTTIKVRNALLTQAIGLNNRDQVVGEYLDRDGVYHGYLWKSGRLKTIDVVGSTGTSVTDINDRGEMVGLYSDAAGMPHGFFKNKRGDITTIDVRGSFTIPWDVNNRGQVVGDYGRLDPNNGLTNVHGFLLAKGAGGPVSKIDVPGASQTGVAGIDDRGRVAGSYETPNAGASAQRSRAATMPLLDVLPLGLGERKDA